jgi:hypothetical protein
MSKENDVDDIEHNFEHTFNNEWNYNKITI